MESPQLARSSDYLTRPIEVFIRIILMSIVAVSCFLIVKPFIPFIAWAIIISIATFPAYEVLRRAIGGNQTTAAVFYALLLLAAVIIPVVLMAATLVGGLQSLAGQLMAGTLSVPPPPASVAKWPLIGGPLANIWTLASTNLVETVRKFSPELQSFVPKMLSASTTVMMTALQFVLSIILAAFLLANSSSNMKFCNLIFDRIFGEKAAEFEELTVATIRSVTNGVLGVAVIQSVFASIGFAVVGLPGAGLWSAIFLVAAVLQAGFLVLLPAVIYAFAISSTRTAVIFMVWSVLVGSMDNILKPILLGRGSKVPIAVIFIGVIGGFMVMGIIGLFIGAIVISVGYKLLLAWLKGPELAAAQERV